MQGEPAKAAEAARGLGQARRGAGEGRGHARGACESQLLQHEHAILERDLGAAVLEAQPLVHPRQAQILGACLALRVGVRRRATHAHLRTQAAIDLDVVADHGAQPGQAEQVRVGLEIDRTLAGEPPGARIDPGR